MRKPITALAGDRRWPEARFRRVAGLTVIGGLTYTVFSEWLVVPLAAFWWARRPFPPAKQPKEI